MTTLLAQISDLHITHPGARVCGKSDTAAFLARCVARLAAFRPAPAAVLVTGDLVDAGDDGEYAQLRALLAPLALPVYLMVGNHDDRAALRRAFPDHAYLARDGFVQYAFDAGELRVIALDSLDPGKPGGRLCAERRSWLLGELAAARDRPVILALHHPPFATAIPFMDACGLAPEDAAALAAIVADHPTIERIVCGHLHRPIVTRFAGTVALTSPSCAHQVVLTFDPAEPAAFTFEPPAFLLHAYLPGAGLITHQVSIDPFDGPYAY
jgi:3',5'-cyclic-AMP phosphodiesterase